MLKYDYFSLIQDLSDNAIDAVRQACQKHAKSSRSISSLQSDCLKLLCNLESALFSDFLPPLDRASIAEYAHTLYSLSECALVYYLSKPHQYSTPFTKPFDTDCLLLCDALSSEISILSGIKKSSATPKLLDFREKKSKLLKSLCDSKLHLTLPSSPHLFAAQQALLFAISDVFDALVIIILKNI